METPAQVQQLDELLTCRLDFGRKALEPCSIVIFGASGDLTVRKLIPALYHLFLDNQLPNPFRIIGFARREKTDESFRAELLEGLKKFSRTKPVNEEKWKDFATNVAYCQGDIGDPKAYEKLRSMLQGYGLARW